MNLFDSICDNLQETFEKLGYSETEVSFNYPPKTLKTLFGNRGMSDGELADRLCGFAHEQEGKLGRISFRKNGDVFLLTVPREGARFVHTERKPDPFLSALVRVTMTFFATKEDVHRVFLDTGRPFTVRPFSEPDLDEVIFFTDRDSYCYCFSYGEERPELHRLLPEDFAELYAPLG